MTNIGTPFSCIYDSFLSKVTDDMYLELNELDTFRMLQELLASAVQKFEFPRVALDYEEEYVDDVTTYQGVESDNIEVSATVYGGGCFLNKLTNEEVNIIAVYMVAEWLGQQLASIENTRMKYTGADFKMTSQANHMGKITAVKEKYEKEGFHLQRLYKRRIKDENGNIRSTMKVIMSTRPHDYL